MNILSNREVEDISMQQMKNLYLERHANLVREINKLQLDINNYYMLCELKVNVDSSVSLLNFNRKEEEKKLDKLKEELKVINNVLEYLKNKEEKK